MVSCNRKPSAIEEFLQGDLGTSLGMENRGEGRFDEVWNLETMFSQLAKRSTRMQVSGIFKQLRTLVIVPDALSKFWEVWECFIFQMQCMVSVLAEIIFYCA